MRRINGDGRLLYLVRHGEHDAGPDAPPEAGELTETGREQAKLTGERLRGASLRAIHHSPWRRAAQTAELIAGCLPGVPVAPCDLLRECVPAVPAAADVSPQQAQFLADLAPDVLAEGPVQAAAAYDRFAGATGGADLLVSHGNLINWFAARVLDAPAHGWWRMLDQHCALTVIWYLPDRVKLVTYNDTGHLPAALRGTGYPPGARI